MAKVIIKNQKGLTKILDVRVSLALKKAQDVIFKAFQTTLNEYYHEPVFRGGTSSIPKEYKRLYKFLNSMIKTEITKSGGEFRCTIEVNPDYLKYIYPDGDTTGREVWDYANEKTHGGTVKGEIRVWNDTIERLGGREGIVSLMTEKLKKCGVPVV